MTSAIRELRIRRGLSQQDVEKMTGISQVKISYIERGLPPTPEEMEKIKQVLLKEV